MRSISGSKASSACRVRGISSSARRCSCRACSLRPAAVAHGNMQVTIAENVQVDQPNPFGDGETVVTPQSIIDVQQDDARMFVFEPGTTLNDLVRAVNQIGAAPGDMIAVLEALKQAGAISGELIVI